MVEDYGNQLDDWKQISTIRPSHPKGIFDPAPPYQRGPKKNLCMRAEEIKTSRVEGLDFCGMRMMWESDSPWGFSQQHQEDYLASIDMTG